MVEEGQAQRPDKLVDVIQTKCVVRQYGELGMG